MLYQEGTSLSRTQMEKGVVSNFKHKRLPLGNLEKIVITMAPDSAVFTQFEFVTFSLLEDVVHQLPPP